MATEEILVIGDVHGESDKLRGLLQSEGLIDAAGAWSGGRSHLYFIGDLVDRGPDGVGAVDLVMRLEHEASAAGGQVQALLGNHDALLLAAHRLGAQASVGRGGTFRAVWEHAGGIANDIERLTRDHIEWLSRRPAMIRLGSWLLVHADASFYLRYGHTVADVNFAITRVLLSQEGAEWDRLLEEFCGRAIFVGDPGPSRAATFLSVYGGRQIVHGHTPISRFTGAFPEDIPGPFVYAANRCVNVDGGMCYGGPGFIARLAVSRRDNGHDGRNGRSH